jgi:hypothetical protein
MPHAMKHMHGLLNWLGDDHGRAHGIKGRSMEECRVIYTSTFTQQETGTTTLASRTSPEPVTRPVTVISGTAGDESRRRRREKLGSESTSAQPGCTGRWCYATTLLMDVHACT